MTDPLLSICVPTYNRAPFVEKLLKNVAAQASKLEGQVDICISNNCSTDDTHQVIMRYQEQYPGLINYGENDKNIGFDRNLLTVMGMAKGKFIWIFGDDDTILERGVERALDFVRTHGRDDVGLLIIRREPVFIDKKTGKRTTYAVAPVHSKEKFVELDGDLVRSANFPDNAFISIQIFNRDEFQRVMREDRKVIEKGLGHSYIHMVVYRLMFLTRPNLRSYLLNDVLVNSELCYNKFLVEDEFALCASRIHIENILMPVAPPGSDMRPFKEHLMNIKIRFLEKIFYMKAFDVFDYVSWAGCIRTFLRKLPTVYGLVFTAVFMTISATPSFVLMGVVRTKLKMKFKEKWKKELFELEILYYKMGKGERRRVWG